MPHIRESDTFSHFKLLYHFVVGLSLPATKQLASFVLNPFCHGAGSEEKQGSIVKVITVS